jgi:hypothetical protein
MVWYWRDNGWGMHNAHGLSHGFWLRVQQVLSIFFTNNSQEISSNWHHYPLNNHLIHLSSWPCLCRNMSLWPSKRQDARQVEDKSRRHKDTWHASKDSQKACHVACLCCWQNNQKVITKQALSYHFILHTFVIPHQWWENPSLCYYLQC